ncbi:hypothetical protein [Roseiarcus sp.]|uniref:hypothetical protein n=1 Tax=Roseiarcus sp. TaxID=1969460 RepID=UPI003BB0A387
MSRHGVRLGLFVLAEIVMMGGLIMMMGRGVVMSGGLMMMLAGRMLRGFCHGVFPPNRSIRYAGCRFDMGRRLQFATTPCPGLTSGSRVFIPQILQREKASP